MFTSLLLLILFIDVAIGATSYWLVAGSQTDWSQLVTYVWILFWPFVILLGLIYYSPIKLIRMILVHDQMHGVKGFRAWTEITPPPRNRVECRCSWSGLPHYRVRPKQCALA
jgi:hypothetical protein